MSGNRNNHEMPWLLPLMALLAFAIGMAMTNKAPIPLQPDHGIRQESSYVSPKFGPVIDSTAKNARGDINPSRHAPSGAQDAPASGFENATDGNGANSRHAPSDYRDIFGYSLKVTDMVLAIFAFLLLISTVWQGILLRRSVDATLAANQRGNDEFRFINRARVSIGSPSVDRGTIHGYLNIRFVLNNTGREPAVSCHAARFIGASEKLIVPDANEIYVGSNPEGLADVIAPGEIIEYNWYNHDFSPQQYAAARENRLFLHVAILLTYRDGDNQLRSTCKWFRFGTQPALTLGSPAEGYHVYDGRQD